MTRLGDEVTVRRFHRHRHRIELLPENSDFKTIVVLPGKLFELEGTGRRADPRQPGDVSGQRPPNRTLDMCFPAFREKAPRKPIT